MLEVIPAISALKITDDIHDVVWHLVVVDIVDLLGIIKVAVKP